MFFQLLAAYSGSTWMAVADAVAKATVLLVAAALMSMLLRRGSAAARHMVWTLALFSVLVLPVLSIALPRWQLPLFQLPASSSQLPASQLVASSSEPVTLAPAPRVSTDSTRTKSTFIDAAPRADASPARTEMAWSTLLWVVWAIGAFLVLARLAIGIIAVQWMSRRTERVDDAPWLAQARSLAAELGISRRIVFLRSGRAAMPMAWGIFRPSVLMPSDADTWPAERLRIVLLHELAHVKRRDCLTHMLAQISCALHWFNPLAWMAARHARTERERACDDLVLAAGTRGPDYADQLIEIARVMRANRFPALLAGASLAMAHRSELEGRLMAILDPRVPRAGVSRVRTAAATTIFAMAVMPLASVQPWTIVPADQPAPQASAHVHEAAGTVEPQERPSPQLAPDSAPMRRNDQSDQRAADAVRAEIQSAIQRSVQSNIQSHVQSHVQSAVQSNVQSSVASSVRASIAQGVEAGLNSALWALDPHINLDTHLDTKMQTQLNADLHRRQGAGGDGQGKATDPRMVAALTAALKDTDKDVRETALHALVQLRDPSIFEPLVHALSDSAPDVRKQAAFALGQLKDRSALPGLTAALKDTDPDVREQAVFALGQMRDPASVDALITAMHDTKPDVRQQAVFALGQIRDRRAVEPLISALKDADADVREQSAFALGQIHDRGAVEALVIALKDSVADVREQVAFALGQIRDPRAIDGLTTALKDASASVRQQAAFALGQLAR